MGQKLCPGWWFGTFFIIPYIGNFIIPSDELIFFRGVAQPPTSCDIQLVGRSIGFMVCNLWLGGDISYVEELGWVVCYLWFYRRKKNPLPSGKHTKNYSKWWSNGDLTTLNGDSTVCELENDHRNSWCTHEKCWFSIVMLVYQRVTSDFGGKSRVLNHNHERKWEIHIAFYDAVDIVYDSLR